MLAARKIANRLGGERAKAIAYHDTIVPLMEEIRKHVDELEMIVDDEMWTFLNIANYYSFDKLYSNLYFTTISQ